MSTIRDSLRPALFMVRYWKDNQWRSLGNFHTMADARFVVEKDREQQANPETFGGLIFIKPGPERHYQIWRADWFLADEQQPNFAGKGAQ